MNIQVTLNYKKSPKPSRTTLKTPQALQEVGGADDDAQGPSPDFWGPRVLDALRSIRALEGFRV